MTLAELTELRDKLVRIRLSGERTLSYAGFSQTFGSVAEIRDALADAERRIAALSGARPVSQIRIRSTKGL